MSTNNKKDITKDIFKVAFIIKSNIEKGVNKATEIAEKEIPKATGKFNSFKNEIIRKNPEYFLKDLLDTAGKEGLFDYGVENPEDFKEVKYFIETNSSVNLNVIMKLNEYFKLGYHVEDLIDFYTSEKLDLASATAKFSEEKEVSLNAMAAILDVDVELLQENLQNNFETLDKDKVEKLKMLINFSDETSEKGKKYLIDKETILNKLEVAKDHSKALIGKAKEKLSEIEEDLKKAKDVVEQEYDRSVQENLDFCSCEDCCLEDDPYTDGEDGAEIKRVPFETITKKDSELPEGVEIVITEGKEGFQIIKDGETLMFVKPVNKVVVIGSND